MATYLPHLPALCSTGAKPSVIRVKVPTSKSFLYLPPQNSYMKKIINTPNAPAPIGPYNQAVIAGNIMFVSGTIAMDLQSKQLVKTSIKEETKMVMDYIGAILTAGGCTFDNVVKSTIFLNDMNNFVHVNEVYASYFKGDFPARATIQAARLPKDANVEISVEAILFNN
jgi:2-iminobutanoate/2-iminopropanoate deaminase